MLRHDSDNPGATPEVVRALLAASAEASHAASLAREGFQALRQRDLCGWETWTRKILAEPDCELKRFAHNLLKEQAALHNTFTLACSNGPTEGHINRVKLIKRSMYGRASFKLLRNKVLYPPA